jgi:hypothetical protein
LGYRSFCEPVFWCWWRAQSFKSVTKLKKRKEINLWAQRIGQSRAN